MHTTTTRRRGRTARGLLAVALATAAAAGGALGFANPAYAANMPDWAADFDNAGDAFEGGGGGGGGGIRPTPLHPDTVSGGGVPTKCTSRPIPGGAEETCNALYPATPLPPAGPTPGYGVNPGIGGPGGKGLSNRDGGDSGCTPSTITRGTRLPTEDEKKRYMLDDTQMMRDDEEFAKEHAEWTAEVKRLHAAWMNTPENKAVDEAIQRRMQAAPGSEEELQAMQDLSDKLKKLSATPEWKAYGDHLDKEPVPYTPPLYC